MIQNEPPGDLGAVGVKQIRLTEQEMLNPDQFMIIQNTIIIVGLIQVVQVFIHTKMQMLAVQYLKKNGLPMNYLHHQRRAVIRFATQGLILGLICG